MQQALPLTRQLESTFHLSGLGTTWRKETLAGLTTFVTLAYTLVVTPSILSQVIFVNQPGDLFGQLVFATAIVSGLSTVLMGWFANYPIALAPGMGLNSLFAFSIVLNLKLDWHLALTAVLIQGLFIVALSRSTLRERLIAAIPNSLKYATVSGIGLFIAYIAIAGNPESPTLGMGLIASSEATKTTLGSFQNPITLIALFGLLFTAGLMVRRVKGGMLWGILFTASLGWMLGLVPWPQSIMALPQWPSDLFGQAITGVTYLTVDQLGNFIAAVFILLFITVFDSVGAMVGLTQQMGQVDDLKGRIQTGKAMTALGIGNTLGALMGVSPVAPYLESAAGISEGGRSGLSSLVTAALLFVSILFIPFLSAMPAFATAPVLVLIGVLMLGGSVKSINWDDLAEAIPAFLVILVVPTSFSLADGLALGFISYVVLKIFQGKLRDLSLPRLLMAVFSLLYFVLITLQGS